MAWLISPLGRSPAAPATPFRQQASQLHTNENGMDEPTIGWHRRGHGESAWDTAGPSRPAGAKLAGAFFTRDHDRDEWRNSFLKIRQDDERLLGRAGGHQLGRPVRRPQRVCGAAWCLAQAGRVGALARRHGGPLLAALCLQRVARPARSRNVVGAMCLRPLRCRMRRANVIDEKQ